MSRLEFVNNKINPTISGEVIRVTSKERAMNTVKLINKLAAEGYMVLINFKMDIEPELEIGCFKGYNSVGARIFNIPLKFLRMIMPDSEQTIMGNRIEDMMNKQKGFFQYVEEIALKHIGNKNWDENK